MPKVQDDELGLSNFRHEDATLHDLDASKPI
jgi:hypothetical protein